jgi:SAM-dependent methyltransferase
MTDVERQTHSEISIFEVAGRLIRGWLGTFVPRTARVLDYGCGYGRSLAELASLGYSDMVGMDYSPAMVERGRRTFPGLDLRVVRALPTAEADASFDAVLLLAVLTFMPDGRDQDAVMDEVRRLLRPGGTLYISDMPLQTNDRNLARYAWEAPRFGAYGIFETDDGAIVRHHDGRRLETLLAGFEVVATASTSISTMNGHAATGVQVLAHTAASCGRAHLAIATSF